MWRHAGTAAAAGLPVTARLTSGAPVNDVALVDARQSSCGTAAFCPADLAPDAGDQATAEQKIIDGYVKNQINRTPDLPPNPPVGVALLVGGSRVIRDANSQLDGQYRAD
jgi:hypothetical protein